MTKVIKRFVSDDSGLETVEYAVMTALVATAIVTAVGLVVSAVVSRFGEVESVINGI